jgi:2-octaprenyl-6-methoxyphenol hydroxylase
MTDVDVLVAGGGPVGAALAAALAQGGIDVRLVEPRPEPDARLRPVALSHGSRLILESLGVFDRFAWTPILAVHVSQSQGFGRTLMRHDELGVPALGYVCNLPVLSGALAAASAGLRTEARVTAWEPADEGVAVTMDAHGAESTLRARLLVLADGGRAAGLDLALRNYGQTAVVTTVQTERPAAGVAWERFTPEGPLALLPFETGAGLHHAVVWTVASSRAARVVDSGDAAFLAELGERFGNRLGRFLAAGPREAYPLALRYRRSSVVAPRVVAVGNAAQTLHPVAGQGLNLGLRDAAELARLARSTALASLGSEDFLACFDRQRRADRTASIAITDSLVRVFGAALPGARGFRGLGLAALDLVPPARRLFARRMMLGLRGFP